MRAAFSVGTHEKGVIDDIMKCLLLFVIVGCTRNHLAAALAVPNNARIETARAKRFQEFHKLCKTCPTLLQPKVDTLTEIVLGLSEPEREELWSNVARRIQEQDNVSGIKTPEEVYKFQTGQDAVTTPKEEKVDSLATKELSTEALKEVSKPDDELESKLLRKMVKTRSKIQEHKAKRARIQRLIHQATVLLSKNQPAKLDVCDETDSAIYHGIDELQQMSRTELKYQRLKYVAQKTKIEQKIAKYRLKLYGVSMELAKEEEAKEVLV